MKKKLFMGVITFCAMFLLIQVTSFAKEANVFPSDDMEITSEEVNDLLDELLKSGETTYECNFVKAEEIATEFSDNDKIFVLPYLDMQIVAVEIPEGEFDFVPLVTWDISAKYDVVESEESGVLINPRVLQAGVDLPLDTGESVTISIPLIGLAREFKDSLKIKHFCQDGKEYYYDTEEEAGKKISFTAPRGLGRFALMVDGRCITIQFKDLEVEDEWDSTDVHVTAFPPMEKAGYIFKGWKVEGLSDLYTGTLTEELLNQLHELSFEGAEPIFAEAVFEAILAEDEPEEEESEQEDAEEEMIVIQESAQEVPAQDVPAQTVTTAVATGDSANVYWYGVLLVIAVVGMKKNKIL